MKYIKKIEMEVYQDSEGKNLLECDLSTGEIGYCTCSDKDEFLDSEMIHDPEYYKVALIAMEAGYNCTFFKGSLLASLPGNSGFQFQFIVTLSGDMKLITVTEINLDTELGIENVVTTFLSKIFEDSLQDYIVTVAVR